MKAPMPNTLPFDLGALLATTDRDAPLHELALIRRELVELDYASPDVYEPPRGTMTLAAAKGPGHDPWPIIQAIRAPSEEILDAAEGVGLGVNGWIRGEVVVLERARRLFPGYSPCKVGFVILSAGLACARAEFEVKALRCKPKLALSGEASDGYWTIDTFFPEGVAAAREHMLSLLHLEDCGMDPFA